jgi:hypothetical protein
LIAQATPLPVESGCPPQLLSTAGSTHFPLHSLNPGLHSVTHALSTQVGAWALASCGHAVQALVHLFLSASPAQLESGHSWKFVLQDCVTQALSEQAAVPFGTAGQALQLAVHLFLSASLAQLWSAHWW